MHLTLRHHLIELGDIIKLFLKELSFTDYKSNVTSFVTKFSGKCYYDLEDEKK